MDKRHGRIAMPPRKEDKATGGQDATQIPHICGHRCTGRDPKHHQGRQIGDEVGSCILLPKNLWCLRGMEWLGGLHLSPAPHPGEAADGPERELTASSIL